MRCPSFQGFPLACTIYTCALGSLQSDSGRESRRAPKGLHVRAVAAMDVGKPLRSGRMSCWCDRRGMRQHGKNVVAFIRRHAHNLGGHGTGSPLLETDTCLGATCRVWEHGDRDRWSGSPVRSLPLVREVREDERLHTPVAAQRVLQRAQRCWPRVKTYARTSR